MPRVPSGSKYKKSLGIETPRAISEEELREKLEATQAALARQREGGGQKLKQDDAIQIGFNIRACRKARGIGQTSLVRLLQLQGVDISREALVKIEQGAQHIQATQLQGIRDVLQVSYDDLFRPTANAGANAKKARGAIKGPDGL